MLGFIAELPGSCMVGELCEGDTQEMVKIHNGSRAIILYFYFTIFSFLWKMDGIPRN